MPEILSPAGVLAATMLLYIPSVFSHTLKCGTTVAKAPGEIHNRTLQTGHWWHPLKSDFHTSLTPNFPSSALHQHRTPRFSLLSYCTGGMKAAKKGKKKVQRRSVSSTLPIFPEVFRYFGITFPGPRGLHITSSGYRLDSDSMTWALTNICSAPDWGRRQSLCVDVLEEVQGERRRSAAGRQRVFMRACFDQGKLNEACACFWDSAA